MSRSKHLSDSYAALLAWARLRRAVRGNARVWAASMLAVVFFDSFALASWLDSTPDVVVRTAVLEPVRITTPGVDWCPAPGPSPEAAVSAPPRPLPPIQLRVVPAVPLEVTAGDLYEALARSPWPRSLWPTVVAIARCESRHGAGVDQAAEGDGGRSLGALQINVTAHPDLARYELRSLEGALEAGWLVYLRAGQSFAPWSCS